MAHLWVLTVASWPAYRFIRRPKYCSFSFFGEELTPWKRPWSWERLKAGGDGDDRGWDGWMASLTQWTWIWANSGNWWWAGKPGELHSIGSQRDGHNWATELNWQKGSHEPTAYLKNYIIKTLVFNYVLYFSQYFIWFKYCILSLPSFILYILPYMDTSPHNIIYSLGYF